MPPTPEQLKEWDRTHVWHGFTQMAEYEPLIISRSEGCAIFDIDGNRYIDGVSSIWCNVHGHRHPKLDEALRRQIDRIAHTTMLGASNPMTIELARRLVEITPAGLEHVFFSDDGSTAVEAALKIAVQYWHQRPDPKPEKNRLLALGGAYHGDTMGSVSLGFMPRFHQAFEPLVFETLRIPSPDTYRLPAGITSETALQHYLGQLEQALDEHHARIAALVIEPLVQGAAGLIMHPPGYLRGVGELTRKYDVLLIADEVAVGFGRTGRMFACEHEQVTPDLICLAKGISGGYLPLAATLTTDKIWQAFLGDYRESKTFFHGHTYAGNPLACAVALASLEVFEQERTIDAMQPKIARLGEHLGRIAKLPHVGDVRLRGLMGAVEIVKDPETKQPFPWEDRHGARICERARAEGVLVRPLGDVIVIMPPLAISIDEIDTIAGAVETAIREVMQQG